MNPLPRILSMALFVVLAALAALLAAPAWRAVHPNPVAAQGSPAAASAPGDERASAAPGAATRVNRVTQQTQRLSLALAMIGLGLAGALLFSLAFRSAQTGGSKPPFQAARTEIGTLAKLAATSVAQGTELNRERDVRRRAEEDVQLKQRLLTQSLEEQVRLGRDLHDGIIQSLYAVGLTLESVRTLVREDPAEADRRLEQCRTALNNSIREARNYITGLVPDQLRHAGFSRALEALLAELKFGRTTTFEVEVDDDATALLTPQQTIEALQIAREAVSNALRHGSASVVKLRVHKGDREICLLVQDNGTGFDTSGRREHGHGLGNMQARATSLGANLQVTSHLGKGTRVIAMLPVIQTASI